MYKEKRILPKILSEKELDIFFNTYQDYKYKIIFMMICGSGLRISETVDIRVKNKPSYIEKA